MISGTPGIGFYTKINSTVKPKKYEKKQHAIPIDNIDHHAVYIIEKLKDAGYEAYLVGGGVRDLLLGHIPKDFDISTSAKPEEIKKIFKRNCLLIGRRFRLAHIRFGKKIFEVSTFRSGGTDTDELIVRDNDWGTAEEDSLRRDFTINGLYYCPREESIIDFVGGFDDIQNQKLRSIGQASLRFKQDPVRMIRLLKFKARFGFLIDEDLKIALLECRSEITKSSQARIFEEILRMLESSAAEKFFELIAEHGILGQIMPGLSDFLETEYAGEIYDLLREVDFMRREHPHVVINRSLLLACLVFPILNHYLEKKMQHKARAPHLGIIQKDANAIIQETFYPFFHIPRRLKAALVNVLHTQYRLVPLDKKRRRKNRIPNVPDFILSLQFLNLRYRTRPSLQKPWEEWNALLREKRKK